MNKNISKTLTAIFLILSISTTLTYGVGSKSTSKSSTSKSTTSTTKSTTSGTTKPTTNTATNSTSKSSTSDFKSGSFSTTTPSTSKTVKPSTTTTQNTSTKTDTTKSNTTQSQPKPSSTTVNKTTVNNTNVYVQPRSFRSTPYYPSSNVVVVHQYNNHDSFLSNYFLWHMITSKDHSLSGNDVYVNNGNQVVRHYSFWNDLFSLLFVIGIIGLGYWLYKRYRNRR